MNNGDWTILVMVVSGIAGILALILGVSFYLDKKRRQQWLEVASALGFESLPMYPGELDGIVGSSQLMSTGRQRAWTNIFKRQVDSLGVILCDYRYTIGSGKNSTTWQQTLSLPHQFTGQLALFRFIMA